MATRRTVTRYLLGVGLAIAFGLAAPTAAARVDPQRLLDRLRWTYFRGIDTFEPERLRFPLIPNAAVELEVARAQTSVQPDNLDAHLRLARLCDMLDLPEARTLAYTRVAQLLEPRARALPDDLDTQIQFHHALVFSGRAPLAERGVENLVAKHPDRAELHVLRGDVALQQAARLLTEAGAMPTDAERRRVEAQIDRAAAAYARARELKPTDPVAYYAAVTLERVKLTLALRGIEKPEEQLPRLLGESRERVLALLLTLAEKRPDDPLAQWAVAFTAFTAIAEGVLHRNELGKGIPPAVAAIAARLQQPAPDRMIESFRREALGFLAMLQGDAATAAREMDAAVRADPDRISPQTWLVACDLAQFKGDYQQAARRAEERLRERQCLHDWLVVAGAAKERNDYAKLEQAARAALRIDEQEPAAHFALGLALLRADPKSDEALTALLRAAELASDPELYLAIATARAIRGEVDVVIPFLRALLERVPPRAADTRMRIEATLKDLETP